MSGEQLTAGGQGGRGAGEKTGLKPGTGQPGTGLSPAPLPPRSPAVVPAPLLGLGVFLVLLGYWRPWIPHKAAGLALTAWDVTEWIKFLPAWRAGTLGVQREWFYLPLIAGGLTLALVAARSRSRLARWALWALGALLCLLVLPPYEFIANAYQGGEWQGQFFVSLAGFALVMLAGIIARGKPDRLYGAALVVTGLLGLALPLWQLALLLPVVSQVYAEPVGWGIGAVLNGVGFLLVILGGLWIVVSRET